MSIDSNSGNADIVDGDQSELYDQMLRIEAMESLLEEIDAFEGESSGANLSEDINAALRSLDVADVGELRRRIDQLHAALDDGE